MSELFAMVGGTVAVKEQVFVAASESKRPLEMCVVVDTFDPEVRNGCTPRGVMPALGGGLGWRLLRTACACLERL